MASLDVIWRGQLRVRRGPGLSRRGVRRVQGAEGPARAPVRAVPGDRQAPVDRGQGERRTPTSARSSNVTLTCRPVQRPHPPIWIAANSDEAVRRAARLGDAWFVNPHATMATITRQMASIARSWRAWASRSRGCGRDQGDLLRAGSRTALERPGPTSARKYRAYAAWGQDAVMPEDDTVRQPFDSLLRDRFVLGSPEECYEQLRPCWEAGRREPPVLPHAVERHAARALALQHATDQRRAAAGAATGEGLNVAMS